MKAPSRLGRWPLAVLFGLVAALSGCSLLPEERVDEIPTLLEPPPSRVITYPVERMTLQEEIRGLGRVAPTKEENMYFTQSGRVARVEVRPGQAVKEGEILVQLETGSLEHELQMAEIDLELARLELERRRLSAAPLDLQAQELNYRKAELRVAFLKERLEAATLRAPFDGIVQSVRTRVGELVQEYNTIVVVADPTALELQMEVRRVEDINKLVRGQKALVEVARDRFAPATVVQITDIDTGSSFSNAKMVHLELDDGLPASGLRLDDLVTVRLIVQERVDTLAIPRAALREFMGRAYVRVLEGEARREVDVEVGIRTSTHVEILRGLSEGAIVIGQ